MSEPAQNSQDSSENKKEIPTQNPSPAPASEICHVSPFTRTIIDIHDLDSLLTKNVNHGVCGGHNLGNTCFMNSSIACLSNCSELTAYFLTEKFKQNINKKNKQGLQGKLAYAWYDLLKQYWTTKTRTGDPSAVKSTVAKKVKKFAGYGQQDSNEFMTEFLSILNEDLNKSDKKEYKELKEKGNDETELDCAKRFWDLHLKRNDSIITDLFCGLLKSNVVCSECGFNNITFDPFNTLTLAIPNRNYIKERIDKYMDTSLFYIPKYCFGKSCTLAIHVPKDIKYKDLGQEINKLDKFGYKLDKLIYIKVSDSKLKNIMDLNEEKGNKAEYIFAFDDLRKNENTKIIPLYMYKSESISAFPRILFLEENATFAELKKQIYYYARNFITSPYTKNEEEKDSLDNKLQHLKNNNELKTEEREKYINDSIELIDKEFNKIFVEDKDKE